MKYAINNNLHSRRHLLQNENFARENSQIGISVSVCALIGYEQHIDHAKTSCCSDGGESEDEYLHCLFEIENVAFWNLQIELRMMGECHTNCELVNWIVCNEGMSHKLWICKLNCV